MRPSRWLSRSRATAGVAAVLVLLLAFSACTSGGDDAADGVAEESWSTDDDAVHDEAEEAEQPEQADDAEVGRPAEDAPEGQGAATAAGDLDAADDARMLVREGQITVAYPVSFDEASSEVNSVVARLDGGVAGIESVTDDAGVTRGTITLEVPVDRFDELLAEMAEVGQVLHRDVTTDDLTEEHVDLESRLRHLDRQEAFYLELFDEADGVEDALSIQRHLEEVQQRKEQVQGRIDQIERSSARSTLAVELVPEGDEPGATAQAGVGFGAYWDDAVAAFVSVAGTLLVIVVGAAPLMLAGGVVLAVVLAAVRVWRRPAAAP